MVQYRCVRRHGSLLEALKAGLHATSKPKRNKSCRVRTGAEGEISRTHVHLVPKIPEEGVNLSVPKLVYLDLCETVFAVVTFRHLASEIPGDFLSTQGSLNRCGNFATRVTHLQTITDTQYRDSELKDSGVDVW